MIGCTCIHILVFYGFLFNCMAVVQASDSMKKLTSVCSKLMVLLLLVHWLFVLALFGVVVIGPWFALYYLVAFHFCKHLAEEEIAGCFTLIVFLLVLWCSGTLPHDVVCWAAVCNCRICWSY